MNRIILVILTALILSGCVNLYKDKNFYKNDYHEYKPERKHCSDHKNEERGK